MITFSTVAASTPSSRRRAGWGTQEIPLRFAAAAVESHVD